MTRPSPHRDARPAQAPTIDRAEAAGLLRAARTAGPEQVDEAVGWAFAALPDHKHARILAIERHLAQGDTEMADVLLTRGLLLRPTDASLTRLRARSLLMQGDAAEAGKEIRLALVQRPRHVATLLLAAEIARQLDDLPRAVSLLQRALRRQPERDHNKALLTQALIDAEQLDQAEGVMRSMRRVPPVLRARLLRAQGRLLEAVELLDRSRTGSPALDAGRQDIVCELIDLLEHMGDFAGLRALMDEVDAKQSEVLIRAGVACLTLGRFRVAALHMSRLRRAWPHRREALSVLVVAAAMLGRLRLAERALSRLHRTPAGADPPFMADLWRRALAARLFNDQCHPLRAGADRNVSFLQPLLRSAVEVFASACARGPGDPASLARQARLHRHRAVCLAAMGRNTEAAAALTDALGPERRPSPPAEPKPRGLRKAA